MSYKRTPNGQFEKGNKGGPGNPFGKQVMQMRAQLFEKLANPDTFNSVIGALVVKAQAGDLPAIKLVLEYTLGKPQDPETSDALKALQILSQPLEKLIEQIITDPNQRELIRQKLAALESEEPTDAHSN